MLTSNHTQRMVAHMKTTLNISDATMRDLKREAGRQGRTMSELVESALRSLLHGPKPDWELPPLPQLHGGGLLVDVADRQALYDVMDR
jgi:hypothetical protein